MNTRTSLSILLLLLFSSLFTACKRKSSVEIRELNIAERLLNSNPDSVFRILKQLPFPEKLDDDAFARWCMLSGRVSDKINAPILSTLYFQRALTWFEKHGTKEEQSQLKLYLGRSYVADGDYNKAMALYIEALDVSRKSNLHNLCGYINCYMGDLYEKKNMYGLAIEKYKTGIAKFKKARNMRSYVCALRDLGREYALVDSLSQALIVMKTADSIASKLDDKTVRYSITNSLGNIYQMLHQYDKAKECYMIGLKEDNDKMPDLMALINLYIEMDSVSNAYELLIKAPQNNPKYTYTIKYFYSQIYEAKGDYKRALESLQEYTEITDSIVYADNQSKILDIEAKYNILRAQKEINDLRIGKQKYIIILIASIAFSLLVLLFYHIYKRRIIFKMRGQEEELSQTKIKMLNLSLELEKKKNELVVAQSKNENIDKLKDEVGDLIIKHKNLQNQILTHSAIFKKLSQLASQNIPGNNKPLITENIWLQITDAVTIAYPSLNKFVYSLCPELTNSEWQYCCFYMFNFDGSDESKLLNLSPNSVRTKRLRLRQRLNITLVPKTTLYEYLINHVN